jgi:acetoin utilization deacetylase AcuC-like enzyme/GNAT superfamily N-acetyltransferase
MIRIRVIYGSAFLMSQDRLEQVQDIFRQSFPEMAGYADRIPSILRNPIDYGYHSAILVAEGAASRVDGFALVMHFPVVECCLLDFIAVRPGIRGSGIGGALYEAAREYCQRIGLRGLYIEVQPDEPDLTPDPLLLKESRQRIRFYEQYGARVIKGTAYATPVGDPPTVAFLLYDGLGQTTSLSKNDARRSVEMIMTRRFGHIADPDYVKHVVDSFKDDPVDFRPFLTTRKKTDLSAVETRRLDMAFALVSTPKHEIHHVKERGYFERPVRVNAIKEILGPMGIFTNVTLREHGEKAIFAVHDSDFVHYLRNVCAKLKTGRPVYPDTFPVRRPDRRPKELPIQAGYYCIDTGTPLYRNAYIAARAAADTALTGADEILAGRRLAYAVCRPPGHHAGRRFYGGFCYFNHAALAAQYLGIQARVSILDVDFHHGNGTQDIFYSHSSVLTISIHGHPDYSYPYFSGYEYETGSGDGLGFNRNFPLPPQTDDDKYLRVFYRAIDIIEQSRPDVLVVSLGFDILKGDPTGTFQLTPAALRRMGERIMEIGRPVLVVQEGGYNIRNIKRGSAEFFAGCAASEAKFVLANKK